jgi:Family of unknown function (DUF5522)
MEMQCVQCNTNLHCGVQNIDACFCNQYPAILQPENDVKTCLCKACLHDAVKQKVETITNNFTAQQAIDNNWIKDLPKAKELIEGIDFYIENGFYVFTKWHHLKRGYCCKNGCRHCGYDYQKL